MWARERCRKVSDDVPTPRPGFAYMRALQAQAQGCQRGKRKSIAAPGGGTEPLIVHALRQATLFQLRQVIRRKRLRSGRALWLFLTGYWPASISTLQTGSCLFSGMHWHQECREAGLSVGRKNGKSALVALLLLSYLVGPLHKPGWRGLVTSLTGATL